MSISNTASNMLSSLFPTSKAKVDAAFETIKADMARALHDRVAIAKLSRSLVLPHFLRRTGIHFVGKCSNSAKVQKLAGFDDVYVARGHGIRVVFKQDGNDAVITAVAAEG